MKQVIVGMDLHSNNVVIGVMDMDGKRLALFQSSTLVSFPPYPLECSAHLSKREPDGLML
jgi:hypothetical protein